VQIDLGLQPVDQHRLARADQQDVRLFASHDPSPL
jgi:hypothetical protein